MFFFFLIKCPDKKYKWSKIFFFSYLSNTDSEISADDQSLVIAS